MTWLADKSAIERLGRTRDASTWAERIHRGLVSIATVTLLEVGYSARNGPDHRRLLDASAIAAMPLALATPAIEQRAVAVQRMLADRGEHRAPSVPDLLVAATAEISGLVVLHVDKDFDLIAEVTGQPMERLST